MSQNQYNFSVSSKYEGLRVDKYIALKLNDISRSYIQKLIKENNILVNGQNIKSNYKLSMSDEITLIKPQPKLLQIPPENIELDILYEDDYIIIVNKKKNMVVHPAPGHYTGTLVNALLYHCKDQLSSINGVLRPGIVHRIDKDTTGALVVCKNNEAHQSIAKQLKEHTITRKYQAIVYHNLKNDKGLINEPIGRHPYNRKKMAVNKKNGKSAITHYRIINRLNHKFNYIECELETGRTHQIRVHMASIHHPLLGDAVYGPKNDVFNLQGQTLHAGVLGFNHPRFNKYIEFKAPLPEYFKQLLDKLK